MNSRAARRPSLPERFLLTTPEWASKARQFTVDMLTRGERTVMLQERERLLDSGVPRGEIRHRAIAERTLSLFFLPLFNQVGWCILHGRRPEELVAQWPGFEIQPHELGSEIKCAGKVADQFPFWNLCTTGIAPWGLLLCVDYRSQRGQIETLLSLAINPVVVENPQAGFPEVYRFAKRNTRKGQVWIDFEPQMTRIYVNACSEKTKQLYEAALRLSRIVPPYWGLRWSEEISPEPSGKRPSKKYRFSGGRLPPASAVEIYSNWMPALDEEGEPGQDEATIRPDDEQRFIGPFTIYTAADAQLADGRTLPALLGQPDATFLHKNEVDIIAIYDGKRLWRVNTYDHNHSWEAAEEGPTKKQGDTTTFPMRVRSRLPLGEALSGRRIERTLYPDGRMEAPTS